MDLYFHWKYPMGQVREEEVSHLTTIDEDPQLNAMEEGYTKSCIKCSEAIFRRHYHE